MNCTLSLSNIAIIGLETMPVTNLLAHLMAVTSELNPNKTQCLQNLEESGEAEERLAVRNEVTAVTMLVKRTKLAELEFHGQQLLHLEWIGTETAGVASILRGSCKIIIIPKHVWLMHWTNCSRGTSGTSSRRSPNSFINTKLMMTISPD